MDQNQVIMAASDLQGNVTLHNVPNMNGTKRNGMTNSFFFSFNLLLVLFGMGSLTKLSYVLWHQETELLNLIRVFKYF